MIVVQPMVVVITVNFNQDQYTIDCVNSLLESKYNNFHVILIDNGSEKRIRETIEKNLAENDLLTIEALPNNLGYVGGINHGLAVGERFSPDYYLILNNDTYIATDSICNLVTVAEKYSRKAIVSGKVYHYDNKNILQYIGQAIDPDRGLNQISVVKNGNEKDIGQYDDEMEMGMLDDIYWLMPAKLFKEIGGYSDYFYLYGEQNDYAFRALKAGYKLIYTPQAKLWHKGGVSTCGGDKKSARIEYWTTMATLKLAVLHLNKVEAKRFLYVWPTRKFFKLLVFLLIGKTSFSNVKAIILAVWHFKYWNVIRYKDNGYNPFS